MQELGKELAYNLDTKIKKVNILAKPNFILKDLATLNSNLHMIGI